MADVFSLTADFFERMANPAYGTGVNDEYALRLAILLREEQAQGFFAHEARRLSDPDTLTAHGWLWFLSYVRSRNLPISGELLMRLAERWSSVSMLVAVIDVATRDEARNQEWLDNLILRTTVVEERPVLRDEQMEGPEALADEEPLPERDVTARAESLLVALMQTGSARALRAATALLEHRWRGHERLVEFFWALADELDEETRAIWIAALSPPRR